MNENIRITQYNVYDNDALCFLQIQMGISGCCWMWSVQGETSSYSCSMQRFVHHLHWKSYFGSLLIHSL